MALVMKQGTRMTTSGLVVGFGTAVATVQYLAQFLYGVTPFDPITFAAAGVPVGVLALAACAISARRRSTRLKCSDIDLVGD
jgi:hypothetical protein